MQENKNVETVEQETRLPYPKEIKKYLDEYIIGQDEAKRTLSVAIYNHYKRIMNNTAADEAKPQIDKSNIILLGDTGSGKTLIIKTIAKMLKVPCYVGNATSITASGYVGDDIESLLTGLLRECGYSREAAEMGIVVIDEGDKIAKKGTGVSITRDVSGECVQQGLLKIVEGTLVGVQPQGGRKNPEQPLFYLDTTNILFIVSGAFVGLEDIVKRRISGSGKIGFNNEKKEIKEDDYLKHTSPQDLRDFGFIPEFVGRFPVITSVSHLTKDDLIKILTEPKNAIISQYKELFKEDNYDLEFSKEALDLIAETAESLKTGARSLRTIVEAILKDMMFEAPGSGSGDLLITKEYAKRQIERIYSY